MLTELRLPMMSFLSGQENPLPTRQYSHWASPQPIHQINVRHIAWKDIWVLI